MAIGSYVANLLDLASSSHHKLKNLLLAIYIAIVIITAWNFTWHSYVDC